MGAHQTNEDLTHSTEPQQLARKFFILTGLGVCAFVTAVLLVVRYMPSNDGLMPIPEPAQVHQHLATAP